MSPEEKEEFDAMKNQVKEMANFIAQNFNPDGTMKNPGLVVEASDAVTTAAGTIRVQTNVGPKNILVAA